jgi:hypothetical protein
MHVRWDVEETGARPTADRLRDAVADALRRVGPPESAFERVPAAPGSGNENIAKGP